MAKSVEKKVNHKQDVTSGYVYGVIIKKYFYYVRYYIIALLLLVIQDMICGEKIKEIAFKLLLTIPQFCLLGQLGFNNEEYYPYGYYVSGSWYLSVLFIIFLCFFSIMSWNYKFFINTIAPLLFVISFSLLVIQYGKVSVAFEPLIVGQAGLIRGVCEVSIGCMIYEISKLIKENIMTKIAEMVTFAIVFLFMCMDVASLLEFPMLIITATGVLCIIVNKQGERFINNKILIYLGQISFPLLFLHEPIRVILNIYINNSIANRVAFYVVSFIISTLILNAVEQLFNRIKAE